MKIPAISAVYAHKPGSGCHSIVAGRNHAEIRILQLRGDLAKGYDRILSSHSTPEDKKDVETEIACLKDLKAIAADCADAEAFKASVKARCPDYDGQNNLDISASCFFPV